MFGFSQAKGCVCENIKHDATWDDMFIRMDLVALVV